MIIQSIAGVGHRRHGCSTFVAMRLFPPIWPTRPLTVRGARGCVAVVGDGAPVVLLPSLFARPKTYCPTVDAIARRATVFVLEVPGSGGAERLARPWTLEEYAGWVGAALGTLAPGRVTLVGHSHAGAVAIHIAHRFPDQLAKLVVADTIGAGRVRVAGGLHDLAVEWNLVRRAWLDVAGNLVRHPRTFVHHVGVCFTTDILPVAREIRVPTIVAWSGRDHTLPVSQGERLAREIPDARLVVCVSGSHDWIISHAEQFAAIV